MNKLTATCLFAAAALLTGCVTSPIIAGAPGQMREVAPLGALGVSPDVARTARRELNADQEPQWRQGN